MAERYIEKELFRTGTFTDMNGQVSTWSESDIDTLVREYDSRQEADYSPVVFGHPETNSPCHGWLLKVWRDGQSMFGLMRTTRDGLLYDVIQSGNYKNVSLALGDGAIIHVGFLGAALPAVSGMSDAILYGKERRNGVVINLQKGTFAMEPELQELKAATVALETRVAAIEQAMEEIKSMLAELSQAPPEEAEQPAEEGVNEETASLIKGLQEEANEASFSAFKNWLDSEDISLRLTPATKTQAIKTGEKVLASGGSFSKSKEITGLRELILSLPKTDLKKSLFSKGSPVQDSSDIESRLSAYKKQKHIA